MPISTKLKNYYLTVCIKAWISLEYVFYVMRSGG